MTIGRMIVQTWRGCHSLPYVGSHPGTVPLAVFVIAGILAGSLRGLLPAAFGGIVMVVVMGSIYLCGAYFRAEESDRMSRHERKPK